MVKFYRNRRNRTEQEKHSVKGIAIAFATALFFNFFVKSFSRKVVQKFWSEVSAIAIAIRFVLLRRFQENLTKPFYFYLSRTCGSPGDTPSVISLGLILFNKFLRQKNHYIPELGHFWQCRLITSVMHTL